MSRLTAIRRQAQELLASLEATCSVAPCGANAGPYAVLQAIAAHLNLDVCDDDQIPKGMWGYLNRTEGLIGYHPELEAPQRHFVIAHEIGHFYLKHPRRQTSQAACDETEDDRDFDGEADINDQASGNALLVKDGMPPRYCERDFLELQANVFAAELLAPFAKVREMTEGRNWKADQLAQYFGLSKEAMANRIFAARLASPSKEEEVQPPKPQRPLDQKQQSAKEVESAALVLAGPGAGKTRVLVERFAYLAEHKGIEPKRILALTYSNKAADEMRNRLSTLPALVGHEFEFQVFTFHSFGQSLILEFADALKFAAPPIMLSEADAFVLLRNHLHNLPMGSFEDIGNPTRHLKNLLSKISRAKDELASPKEFACEAEKLEGDDAIRAFDVARIYAAYGRLLKQGNFLDFGDLIRGAVRLLNKPEGEEIRGRYDAVLVDEFQDINFACGELVRLLDPQRNKTWVVADPRQSIYGFRGASRANLENFKSDFPSAELIHLDTNYRSLDGIVRAGDAVDFSFCQEDLLPTQRLHSDRGTSSTPAVIAATTSTRHSEVKAIVGLIEEELSTGRKPKNIAVLCRTRDVAKQISDALEAENIATTWAGFLQEQTAFKDLMAVLLFASGQMSGLLRLARCEHHALSEPDLQKITRAGQGKGNGVLQALYAARDDKIEGLSLEGKVQSEKLRHMALHLKDLPNAFAVLSAYLLHFAPSLWEVFDRQDAQAQRYRAAANQMLDLAREFSSKGSLSKDADAGAFVDYVRSSLEIENLNTDDSTEALGEAVRVTTIHKSKGLEWEVVFAPDWTRSEPFREQIPFPPTLLHHNPTHQEEYDRACVAYVALTRARDRLFISRSQQLGREPNPQFDRVVETLSASNEVQVVKWPHVQPAPDAVVAPGDSPVHFSKPIPFSLLSQYLHCGQSAKYEYIYGLRTESSGYLLALNSIRETLRWLRDSRKLGHSPSQEQIEEHLNLQWEETGPTLRQIAGFYRPFALKCLLKLALERPESSHFDWHKSAIYDLRDGLQLAFHVDEIEYPFGQPPVIRFYQWHGRTPTKPQELQLALYRTLSIGGQKPQIYLHNVQDGTDTPIILSNTEYRNRIRSIENSVEKLVLGEFAVCKKRHCNYCPFLLVCPS